MYSPQEIVRYIRECAAANGGRLLSDEYKRLKTPDAPSLLTISRYFGSWRAALDAAGLAQNTAFRGRLPQGMKRCVCGTPFQPKCNHQKYCTNNCRYRHKQRIYRYMRAKEGRCPQCNGEWIPPLPTHRGIPEHCRMCQIYYQARYERKKNGGAPVTRSALKGE